jgi:anti-anti-sigma factor
MEIQRQNGTLTICGLRDLSIASLHDVRHKVGAGPVPGLKRIEIDLSVIDFVDCSGVGALVSFYHSANGKSQNEAVSLCLLNPRPAVRQMFELTGTHRLFEIMPAMSEPA